jgi:hypothetical protein
LHGLFGDDLNQPIVTHGGAANDGDFAAAIFEAGSEM